MCSFEVHCVYVAQKIKKLEGPHDCNCSLWRPPPNLSFLELRHHEVPQKNTFFSQNSDTEQKHDFT